MELASSYARPNPPPEFAKARLQHLKAFTDELAADVERASWAISRVRELQQERLRAVLRHAVTHSTWHAERLRGLDIDSATTADLVHVPPMTKQDLIENWDDISCDPALTLNAANEHLRRAADSGIPEYFRGEYGDYLIFASGGSSGLRAAMAYDFDGWLAVHLSSARVPLAGDIRDGHLDSPRYLRTVGLFSASAANVHGVAPHCFTPLNRGVYFFDPSTPIDRLVTALNEIQPEAIHCFPSVMHALAGEALGGRLDIQPYHFMVSGEPLLPEARAAVDKAFGARIYDYWAATETGPLAMTDGHDDSVMSVPEDSVVVELADDDGRKGDMFGVLVTNLVSRALPLIRYEITDNVEAVDEPIDRWPTGRKIARVSGRLDEGFAYQNGITVHAASFRTVMSAIGEISEYQIRQTLNGVEVLVRTTGTAVDVQGLEDILRGELVASGLARPHVIVREVSALKRHAQSGKIKRFVPLG